MPRLSAIRNCATISIPHLGHRRTTPAAPSWAPTPRPARSIAICSLGPSAICSSWEARLSRRTLATIRPERSRPSLTGPPGPSRRSTSNRRVPWCRRERACRPDGASDKVIEKPAREPDAVRSIAEEIRDCPPPDRPYPPPQAGGSRRGAVGPHSTPLRLRLVRRARPPLTFPPVPATVGKNLSPQTAPTHPCPNPVSH